MSVTLTLRNSMNFASAILKKQTQMVNGFEPALTAANIILGTMCGPPMSWPFNRGTFDFAVSKAGGTDYTISLPDFRFLETQWIVDAKGNIHQVTGETSLAKESNALTPNRLAVQYDDNQGNITFRLTPLPNADYTMWGDYQKKAMPMLSDAATWGVVPDEFGYIFNLGFLGMMMLLTNDVRFPIFLNLFIARLLGAQDGLTEQQKNIFVADWMAMVGTLTRTQGAVTAGLAGRSK